MRSYDYARRDVVHELTWDDVARLSRQLVERLAPLNIDLVVGVARAGLFPATAIACALRRDLSPVRLSRRVNDEVVREQPEWLVPVSEDVSRKVVAVVDEIADTGTTLALVAARVRELGAVRVVTACLVQHSWAEPSPDYAALRSDAFVVFPWDREVYVDGRWHPHPEIAAGLAAQEGGRRPQD